MTTKDIHNKFERIPVKNLVSKRDIGIEAFELENGYLMLEATFLDPYHLIRLNLLIDPKTRTIMTAKSEFANHPHAMCPKVAIKAKLLIGLKIERGITKQIMSKIGGSEGCVHLRELALETINFAATALIGYNEGFGLMSRDFNILDEHEKYKLSKSLLKNTCCVYNEKDC
ncbi:MAG: hypothetical protein A2046_00305 [Bacteroidetes bacterium GWA2_30_7]|nr:MAG: hypothetical protein A2046_00305 [Bacteroidetes bacterium GWA2_30_7]